MNDFKFVCYFSWGFHFVSLNDWLKINWLERISGSVRSKSCHVMGWWGRLCNLSDIICRPEPCNKMQIALFGKAAAKNPSPRKSVGAFDRYDNGQLYFRSAGYPKGRAIISPNRFFTSCVLKLNIPYARFSLSPQCCLFNLMTTSNFSSFTFLYTTIFAKQKNFKVL